MLVPNPLRIDYHALAPLGQEARGEIKHIYLHWTAGHYGQAYDDYHINIDGDGSVYQTCVKLTERKAHTWRRNTGAIGIAVCCAYNARCGRTKETLYLGDEPITLLQINALAWVLAHLCQALDLPLDAEHVLTHAEAATLDGYGPYGPDPDCRWDLYLLPKPHEGTLLPGGEVIREMASERLALLKKYKVA